MNELDIKIIQRYWSAALTVEEIVQMLPYPKTVSRSMIKALKADGTLPKRSKEMIVRHKLAEAYNSGITDVDVLAEAFCLSPNTVVQYLHREGIRRQAHRRPYRRNDRYHEITEAVKQGGESISALARRFAVSRQYVHQLKKKLEDDTEL